MAATGDPHLQNIHGERFDLMKPGKHVLIHIPRGEPAETTLLSVEAEARQLGGQCADMYFQEVNILNAYAVLPIPERWDSRRCPVTLQSGHRHWMGKEEGEQER